MRKTRSRCSSSVNVVRLLLGSDALRLAERSARARAREASVWAGVSESTDFDSEDRMPALHLPRLSA